MKNEQKNNNPIKLVFLSTVHRNTVILSARILTWAPSSSLPKPNWSTTKATPACSCDSRRAPNMNCYLLTVQMLPLKLWLG